MTDQRTQLTRADFLRGWLLLTSQPWGRSYRSTPALASGEPTPADVQCEFYYTKLHWATPDSWLKVAELYAQGEEWPSLSSLKRALLQCRVQSVTAITDRRGRDGIDMPEEVRALLTKIGVGKDMPKSEQAESQ